MAKDGIKRTIKREVVRAMLERSQSMDLEKMGAPKAEDAVHFENVKEILNVPYMNRDEVPLAMDIFEPVVPEGTELPVIVTIHGGGLTMGDRKLSRPFGRILANKGYLVFSIEYRLAPRANVCMELDDICAGLDLVGRRLIDYDIDFNRIFIAAESAGAYLAAYVTAMKGSRKLQEAIGYEPTRVSFKAIGLLSGMLYTNRKDPNGWMLSEQIYGEKRADESFLQYMNPEHPEIINNLPPAFLITSKADFLNNYSVLMNEALKKAGKPCRLLYYGDDELQHAFTTLQTENPKAIDSIDRMLAWFEEQAEISANREKTAKEAAEKAAEIDAAVADGSFDDQRVWSYIKERAAADPERAYAPAIKDASRTYTYAQMFEYWDKYAKVFTALGITDQNKSRAAIIGSISAEPIFSYYALNMTGAEVSMFSYPDLLPGGRWKTMVEKEHITDLIISDIMVTPQMWEEIRKVKTELGVRNIILTHTRMGGPCLGYGEMLFNEFNYHALKRIPDVVMMDDLIEAYKDTPVYYAENTGDQIAVIAHTSGTTKGTRKPLPYTNRMVNRMASDMPGGMPKSIHQSMGGIKLPRMNMLAPFDFSASSNINGYVNTTIAYGNAMVLTFFGFMHPKFVRAFKYYKTDFVFASGFMLDKWMELPDLEADAFSDIKVLGFGGSYISPAKSEKYEAFVRAHGFKGFISMGYGMSELAGTLFVLPPNCKRDILGYPDYAENYRILDETDGKFYKISDGIKEGILYGKSNAMCLNKLDGELLFELTEIEGENFVCMHDVVRSNEDGSLSYVGRSNQYFVNNEGVKFESAIVENQLSEQMAINRCAVVPVLDKRIHDTVPVLYVVPEEKGEGAAETIRKAIANVFVNSEELRDSVLPSQYIIVDSIPYNATGKIDIFQITRSRLQGSAYNIIPVKNGDELVDVAYEKAEQLNSNTGGTLPEGMGQDSAYGIFEVFNSVPAYSGFKKNLKEHSQMMKNHVNGMKPKLPDIKLSMPEMNGMPQIPKALMVPMTLFSILIGNQETAAYDYED